MGAEVHCMNYSRYQAVGEGKRLKLPKAR
jgi:hypothetical protein